MIEKGTSREVPVKEESTKTDKINNNFNYLGSNISEIGESVNLIYSKLFNSPPPKRNEIEEVKENLTLLDSISTLIEDNSGNAKHILIILREIKQELGLD